MLVLLQDLDTEIVVATARGPNAAAISANVVVDERQMNALFLDVVSRLLACLYKAWLISKANGF